MPAEAAAPSPHPVRGRRHVYSCPLRWGDMDAFGHVNNTVYLVYLEQARVDLLYADAVGRDRARIPTRTVVARHEISYRRPLVFRPEPVSVEMWVTKIGGASFDVAYEVRDDGAVYATALSTLVSYDGERPRRLSPDEREALAEYLPDQHTG